MNRWLVKTEPGEYSAKDLEAEGRTLWTGVSNPVAQKHLRAMTKEDPVFVYHTGDEKAIVALARVGAKPKADPDDRSGKSVLVELEFDRWLKTPVTLAQVKAEPLFAQFELVRISRLSVMPVSGGYWNKILSMAGESADE